VADKLEYLLNILNENKQIPFVDRVLNFSEYPKPTLLNENNQMQTHLMSASPDSEGNWFVYPNVVFEKGAYKKLDLSEDDALKYAKKTGNFISFGKDKDGAIDFSKNYKTEAFKQYYKGLLQE
tara:strand:+ start:922 stop:1290 length:369 start_codon:yes stop_codon:yes gene_type:complete